jgi:adenylylsulfate kinase-like enzyme
VARNLRPGTVFWITGLSGAGKSTVAGLLCGRLRDADHAVLMLDGDTLRSIFGFVGKHAPHERLALATAYGHLCREVSEQGIDVVCATVSMFHSVRRWNRENISSYREIYLKVPLEELHRRDTKGLYKAVKEGREANVVGMDVPAELPECPDLTIENHAIAPGDAADLIWKNCVAPARAGRGTEEGRS